MKCSVNLERWEWPIFTAEACGFDYIQVLLREPSSQLVEVKATIPLKDAQAFGERLITLVNILRKEDVI